PSLPAVTYGWSSWFVASLPSRRIAASTNALMYPCWYGSWTAVPWMTPDLMNCAAASDSTSSAISLILPDFPAAFSAWAAWGPLYEYTPYIAARLGLACRAVSALDSALARSPWSFSVCTTLMPEPSADLKPSMRWSALAAVSDPVRMAT